MQPGSSVENAAARGFRRSGSVKQRQIVIVGGVCRLRHRTQLLEVCQPGKITLCHLGRDPGVELDGPVIRLGCRRPAPHRAQVVHDVAAADDQHAPVAQVLELPAQRQVLGRRPGVIHAELDHRNVRFGKHRFEHGPGAVVQAPVLIVDPYGRLNNAPADVLRGRRRSGRGVLLVEELLWKAAEVVDGPGAVHARHPPVVRKPMCGDAENQLGPRQALAELCAQSLPATAVFVVLDGVHRAAMAHEKDRQPFGFLQRGELVRPGRGFDSSGSFRQTRELTS
jgi:hypothetical protein